MRQILIGQLKGVGTKRAEAFAAAGICMAETLLYRLPRDYLDYSKCVPVAALKNGMQAAVRVRISADARFARVSGMTLVSAQAQDETGGVLLRWFNQPYRRRQVHAGETVYACGRVDTSKGRSLLNPMLAQTLPGILPVYPAGGGLTQRVLRDTVRAALDAVRGDCFDPLPAAIRERYGLCNLAEALENAHFPIDEAARVRARTRLTFENALLYLLAVELEKDERRRGIGTAFRIDDTEEAFLGVLPFRPTAAQSRAMCEIASDMGKPVPMNRLLQGDVGSGKTAVAAYALLIANHNGYQGVLMAPTEILAAQHYETLSAWFPDDVLLLTGGMRKKERDAALKRIADGSAKIIVGTHALLQEDVRFQKLGLVVTDEQHRFGVAQRAVIAEKAAGGTSPGLQPDVLVMSATPIPRTLALILFGDLDASVLDELPPGRKPVKTRYIAPDRRDDMYRYIEKEAASGRQTYVVCPLVEDVDTLDAGSAESIYEELKAMMPGTAVALLHGRMKSAEKRDVLERFRSGETRVLVSTTVIEVGVHVEQAAIMVIENCERFGLAQLHQLRGRVGRGSEQAYCFLLAGNASEQAEARVRAMTETNDGFEIAERDLALRGPGEFLGTQQHGISDGALLSAGANLRIIKEAQQAAKDIMELPTAENNAILERASRLFLQRTQKIAMN